MHSVLDVSCSLKATYSGVASYSREAEAAADGYAFGSLTAANISAAALGDLFARLRNERGDTEDLIAHFVGHPSLGDRIAKARGWR